ncbi:MAG TPA: hypothetical protein V6C81_22045 [Planktothrix sp.]|jgi:hypothetical protein
MVQSLNHSDATHVTAGTSEPAVANFGLLELTNRGDQVQPAGPVEVASAQAGARTAGDAQTASRTADVQSAVSQLTADVTQTMDAGHRAQFMKDLQEFLSHAHQKNLSQTEIARTLEATAKLLEGAGDKPLGQHDRTMLASTMMHNINHCDRVDQGFHNTCNVTAISKVVLADDPATYAEMISSTALNSYYQAKDGKRIKIDAQSLEPDSEAATGETAEQKRNYATQIFDLVSINNYWQRRSPPMSYIQRQSTGAGDTGERMLNSFGQAIKKSDGSYLDQPSLDCRAMATIGKEVGIKDQFLVANRATDAGAGAIVGSEGQLKDTLLHILGEGHPAMIFVHSGNKLFTGKYGVGGGGWHVVTIDGYDPVTQKFHLCNQWGSKNDQNVSVADLYDATLPPNKWAYCPNYFNKDIFEAYHQQMAGGGAGLAPDQVMTKGDFDSWLNSQKQAMQQEAAAKLAELTAQLAAARASGDDAEIQRLEDWIRQTRDGLR